MTQPIALIHTSVIGSYLIAVTRGLNFEPCFAQPPGAAGHLLELRE